MVSSITETAAPPIPPRVHTSNSDSDLTPEVSSNEENSQEIISTNKFDSENCFSDVSDDSGSKSASVDEEDDLKTKNKHLEQKLAELEIKLQENKLVIQSLGRVLTEFIIFETTFNRIKKLPNFKPIKMIIYAKNQN